MTGRLALVTLLSDARHQTRRALDLLRGADVVVTDEGYRGAGLPRLPGALALTVGTSDEARSTLREELLRGQAVVRAVAPDRVRAVLAEEVRPLAEEGVYVEVTPFVRPEDVAAAHFLMPPALAGRLSDEAAPLFFRTRGPDLAPLLERLQREYGSDTAVSLVDERGRPFYGPVALGLWSYAGDSSRVWGVLVGPSRARFAAGSLAGRRVLILRTPAQGEPLRLLVEDAGAVALEAPVLQISPPDWSRVDPLLAGLERYRWLVFTSQNGVEAFFDRLRFLKRDIRSFDARIAAVGSETRRRLEDLGLVVDLVPDPGRSRQQGLLHLFREMRPVGQSILIATGDRRSPNLAKGLRELGAVVDEAIVYRTEPAPLPAWVEPELMAGGIDAVAFTSGSTARFLVEQLSEAGLARLRSCCLVAIGPATRAVLDELKLPVAGEADQPGPAGIVEALGRCLRISSTI